MVTKFNEFYISCFYLFGHFQRHAYAAVFLIINICTAASVTLYHT